MIFLKFKDKGRESKMAQFDWQSSNVSDLINSKNTVIVGKIYIFELNI
jgi:hypothetical protein